jgi:hypothetical protein
MWRASFIAHLYRNHPNTVNALHVVLCQQADHRKKSKFPKIKRALYSIQGIIRKRLKGDKYEFKFCLT